MDKFYIGQEVSVEKLFTREEVLKYAELTGDNNPLHVDCEYAKNSRFGNNIVHGMLAMGIISKILGTQLPGYGSIYLEQKVKFIKPIYIGNRVLFKVKIVDIKNKIITLETNVYDEETCLVSGIAKMLYEGVE